MEENKILTLRQPGEVADPLVVVMVWGMIPAIQRYFRCFLNPRRCRG